MRAGVTGVSVTRTPNDASASSMALAIAAGGEMAPPSPSPLAPSGLRGDGNSRWTVSIGGRSWAFGPAESLGDPAPAGPLPPRDMTPRGARQPPSATPPWAQTSLITAFHIY